MTNKNIDDLRDKIDGIDAQILRLLNQRADTAMEIGKVKSRMNSRFHFPDRERKLMDRLCSLNTGPLKEEMVRAIYREIVSATLSLEKPLKIAHLGPPGTFSHIAVIERFGSSAEAVPKKSFDEVFREAEQGGVEYGVVPVENSIEGMVSRTLDLLMDTPLTICDEILLPIHHHLLSKCTEIKEVKKIYSHYQPTAQCRNWLNSLGSSIIVEESSSTARAAQQAAAEQGAAAIAGKYSASLYGLNIIAERIEDVDENITRFLVIGDREREQTGNDKTSLLVSVQDRPGVLNQVLEIFSGQGINLTKIESRPVKKRAWEYLFFIDIDGHRKDPAVSTALDRLSHETRFVKILGSYPKGK